MTWNSCPGIIEAVIDMTMKELAKIANVSVSTVSKAFGDAQDIAQDTKNYIFETAKQYGCFGKFYKGKYVKKIIAIICPEFASNYYAGYVKILQELIRAENGICVLSSDEFSTSRQAELIEYYASYLKVDGLIVFGLRSRIKKGYDIPIVSLFSSSDDHVDSVNTDMDSAIHQIVKTLQQYGHRRVAFVGETLTKGKAEIFCSASQTEKDMEMTVIQSNQRFEKAGIDGIDQLLKKGKEVTAIVCAYDDIAYGVIHQLKSCGYRVPEDISVVGIDNISSSEYSEIPLTSIDTQPEEMCRIVWDLLQKKIENRYFRAKQKIIIKPELVIRDSLRRIEPALPGVDTVK